MKSTKSYDTFKFLDGNRQVMPGHVLNLMESIRNNNFLSYQPILVDKQNHVIDGQHRLMAAKNLNLPIYYQVVEKADDALKLLVATNSNKKVWRNEDYFNFYVSQGYPEYLKLRDFLKSLGLSFIQLTYIYLTKLTHKEGSDEFKNGLFIFEEPEFNSDLTNEIRDLIETLVLYTGIGRYYYMSKKMFKTLKYIIQDVNYNKEHFISNIKSLSFKISPKNTLKENLRFFVYIHNHRLRKKIELNDYQDDKEE